MFKINPAPTFSAPVSLTVPGQDESATLDITFQHKGKQALSAWIKAAVEGRADLDSLTEVVAGWDGVSDDAGNPLPFSPEALATLLDQYPAAAGEFYAAYRKALTESRAKN
ncbi:MAG: phage tail assembly chaperone [Rhodocyclaceae bacterium]|nr:phage tail assembly chaperone [Rhodocyclaceae bacterium]